MTASLLIPPVARFWYADGTPLAGGKVYTYEAGTNTPKAAYTDAQGNVAHTNPIILDSAGEASIWLDGNYKINVTDEDDVQQPNYPVDNVSSFGGSDNYYVTTGSPNAYVLTPSPALTSYANGTTYLIQASFTNTGPATINISSLGAKSLVKNGSSALSSGDMVSGQIYQIVYDGTNFQISLQTTYSNLVVTNNLTLGNAIVDTNGNELIKVSSTALATNEFTVANAAAGTGPTLSATGTDSNIDLNLQAKGTGVYNLKATVDSASEIRLYEDTDNGVNYVGIKAPSTIASNVTNPMSGIGGFIITGGDANKSQVITTPGAGTFTTSANIDANTNFLFILQGAGGSGSSNNSAGNSTCGGGGGGCAYVWISGLAPSTGYSYNIGAGGAAVSGATNGNAGGNTSITINGTTYSGNGGAGGTNGTTDGASLTGVGGTTTNATLGINGGSTASFTGSNARSCSSGGTAGFGGGNGAGFYGNGVFNGNAGTNGGGGSGSGTGGGNSGAGGNGFIIAMWN